MTMEIDILPNEMLTFIFARLPRHTLVETVALVNYRWRDLTTTPLLWREVDLGRSFDRFRLSSSFMQRHGLKSVQKFHLTSGDRFVQGTVDKLASVLEICRKVSSVSFDFRLASTDTSVRESLFAVILDEGLLPDVRSLAFNLRGDWDNHEIYQTLNRFSTNLQRLTLRCHIPLAVEILPRIPTLRFLDLDLKGIQESGIGRVVVALRQASLFLHSLSLKNLQTFGDEDFRLLFNNEDDSRICRNLTSLSLSSFRLDFRLLGRLLFFNLPYLEALVLKDVDLTGIGEALVNPFGFLPRSLRSLELTLNMKRLNGFSGDVNEFTALYLMVYRPLAEFFFHGVSKIPRLDRLVASLILYEPLVFEWQMAHCANDRLHRIVSIEDRELTLTDFLMLFRRLDHELWIFQAYRSLTLRVADSLTDVTMKKLRSLIRKSTNATKMTMTMSGKISDSRRTTQLIFAHENLQKFVAYSSHFHGNGLGLFLADGIEELDKWKNLVELKLFGFLAGEARFLSVLSSRLPGLRYLDLSCPDGLLHNELPQLRSFKCLVDGVVTVSAQSFHRTRVESKFGLEGLTSSRLRPPNSVTERRDFHEAFAVSFLSNLSPTTLDEALPQLDSLKVVLQASQGVVNVIVARDCLGRLAFYKSWDKDKKKR